MGRLGWETRRDRSRRLERQIERGRRITQIKQKMEEERDRLFSGSPPVGFPTATPTPGIRPFGPTPTPAPSGRDIALGFGPGPPSVSSIRPGYEVTPSGQVFSPDSMPNVIRRYQEEHKWDPQYHRDVRGLPPTQVTDYIMEKTGRKGVGLFEPIVRPEDIPIVPSLPYVGGPLSRQLSALTSPFALETLALSAIVAPGLTAAGVAGSVGLGTVGGVAEEQTGIPGLELAGTVGGGFLTPGVFTRPGQALIGGAKRGVVERVAAEGGLSKLVTAAEAGGTRRRPSITLPDTTAPLGTSAVNRSDFRGTVIGLDDERIPDVVYHVTTNASAVEKGGILRAGGAGGLGGDPKDRIVSMTVSREVADQLAEDIKFSAQLSKIPVPKRTDGRFPSIAYAKKITAALKDRAAAEGWDFDYTDEALLRGVGSNRARTYDARDWMTFYFNSRETFAKIRNPIIFTDVGTLGKINPENVRVLEIPRENLRTGALVTDFDLGRNGLEEIRIYGDVPIGPQRDRLVTPAEAVGMADVEADLTQLGRNRRIVGEEFKGELQGYPRPVTPGENLAKRFEDSAVAAGGLTRDWSRTTFILRDGRRTGWASEYPITYADHDLVVAAVPKDLIPNPTIDPGVDRLPIFMRETGAVRVRPEGGGRDIGFEIGGKLSVEQKSAILEAAGKPRKGVIRIDVVEASGDAPLRSGSFTDSKAVGRFLNELDSDPPWGSPIGRAAEPPRPPGGEPPVSPELGAPPMEPPPPPRPPTGGEPPIPEPGDELSRAARRRANRPQPEPEEPLSRADLRRLHRPQPSRAEMRREARAGRAASDKDLVSRFIAAVKGAKKPRAETELLKHEELQRRAAAAGRALEGKGLPSERLRAARRQQAGELPSQQFEAARPQFTDAEYERLLDMAISHNFGPGKVFTRENAGDAFTAVMMGKLPTIGDINLLEKVFGPDMARALLAKRALGEKAWQNFLVSINVPRTLMTVMDHSFPGRQGIKLAPSHPKEWWSSAKAGARALFDERYTAQIDEALLNDSTPILVKQGAATSKVPFSKTKEMSGLYHADFEQAVQLAEREEAFIARWLRDFYIPTPIKRGPKGGYRFGLGKVRPVGASERGFLTAGNKIRSDIFKKLVTNATADGTPIDLDTLKGYAQLLNEATGRGNLGPLNKWGPLLSGVQFSPRFRVSQVEWNLQILNKNPAVRREAAKQMLMFYTTGITLLAVIKASGVADVEIDPRSSDFGKIRIGKQRIDFWGGMQPVIRSIAQAATQQRKSATGEIVPVSPQDVGWRYFRSGMSPAAGLVTDIQQGESIVGEEIETTPGGLGTQAFNRLTPLAWQDIIEATREEGLRGAIFAAPSLFGISSQTYETEAERRAKLFKDETGMEFDVHNPGHWAVMRTNPAFKEFTETVSEKAEETQKFLTEQTEKLRLPEMAASLAAGNTLVGPQFAEAWEDFEGVRADTAARLAYGRDQSKTDPTYLAWRNIDRNDYRDPETFEIDYGSYRRDKDAAFERLPQVVRDAIKQVGAADPAVAQMASLYVEARETRRALFDVPKWKGMSSDQSREIDEFLSDVKEEAPRLALQSGRRVTELFVARKLALEQGRPDLLRWYRKLASTGARARLRNPDYDTYLGDHLSLLSVFFPELYSQAELERLGLIEGSRGISPMAPSTGIAPMAPLGVQ